MNWLGVAEAVALPAAELAAEPAALVTDAAALEAADAALLRPLAIALLRLDAADSRAEEASETIADVETAADEVADAAAEVADATAELAAEEASGISMGTPAPAQVVSTASMVVCWSAAEQAPCTQGWTVASSLAPCLQWQAKSVMEEQPSLLRGVIKQVS